jgi:hypothetical protein
MIIQAHLGIIMALDVIMLGWKDEQAVGKICCASSCPTFQPKTS